MANDLNVCTFIGRLGADPEIRAAGSTRVANMRLAVGEQWKDKEGSKQERTEWVSVTAWGDGLVGIIEKFVTKGSRLYIQGKMQTRKWQDKEGADRYSTEIVLQGFDAKMIMLDGKSDGAKPSGGTGGNTGGGFQRPASRPAPASGGGFGDDLDSDLPF